MFEEHLTAIFICSQSFYRKTREREKPEKYFFVFLLFFGVNVRAGVWPEEYKDEKCKVYRYTVLDLTQFLKHMRITEVINNVFRQAFYCVNRNERHY